MSIRNRLTWLFRGIVAVLLLGVLASVFALQLTATRRELRQRLRERTQVTGYIYLEKDEMRASAFRDFEKKGGGLFAGDKPIRLYGLYPTPVCHVWQ